jgi:hypothetical protein
MLNIIISAPVVVIFALKYKDNEIPASNNGDYHPQSYRNDGIEVPQTIDSNTSIESSI